MRNLIDQGKSIVFITHKLREVLAVADRITVLRNGRVVGTADPADATQQSLATLMVGRDVSFTIDKAPARPAGVVLQASGLTVQDDRGVTTVNGLDLEVRAGEVFGIAGVEGNGQRELVEALVGMRSKVGGTVEIEGHDVTHATPREVLDLDVAHVPEDRRQARRRRQVQHRRQPHPQPLLAAALRPAWAAPGGRHRPGGSGARRSGSTSARPAPTSPWTTCRVATSRR